jgi:NAD(P)H-hydrate epimerase
LYVPQNIYPIVASAAAPEVMVQPVESYLEVLRARHDVLALGPGIGHSHCSEVLDLIRCAEQPMVIDADGLNLLSQELIALELAAGPRLLTPHPGEMARLAPDLIGKHRSEIVSDWTSRHRGVLLLKGARTMIGEHGRPTIYNSTGNPGMASGGMGDVLTGVLAALIGRGLEPYDAAQAGAWLCGRAAEIAISSGFHSVESLSATAVISNLGGAFESLRARCY